MRLLLVEDNESIGKGIHSGLSQAGYAVDWVKDGSTAQSALTSEEYDIAVLDLGLPKQSGLEVLDDLRARGNDVPVLILTARDTINDRIIGLDHGADDYMVISTFYLACWANPIQHTFSILTSLVGRAGTNLFKTRTIIFAEHDIPILAFLFSYLTHRIFQNALTTVVQANLLGRTRP